MAEKLPKKLEGLTEIFEKEGVDFEVLPTENCGEFYEAIVFPKKEVPKEKLIRIYRGINHLNEYLLKQVPYAMRTEGKEYKMKVLEDVKQDVINLANNPTYGNLLSYTSKIKPLLTKNEIGRMNDKLSSIEDDVLKESFSVRKGLVWSQIEHNGGFGADSGISPYISASHDPNEAAGYGKKGIIIIDLPVSQIEDFNADDSETSIKGPLDPKYISGVILRDYVPSPNKYTGNSEEYAKEEEIKKEGLEKAILKINDVLKVPLYDYKDTQRVREDQLAKTNELDKKQWQTNLRAVRQNRTEKLIQSFPEVGIDPAILKESGTEDIYSKAKTQIFDYYSSRAIKAGRKIDWEDFQKEPLRQSEFFYRSEGISDPKLYEFREQVQRYEQLQQKRAEEDKKWREEEKEKLAQKKEAPTPVPPAEGGLKIAQGLEASKVETPPIKPQITGGINAPWAKSDTYREEIPEGNIQEIVGEQTAQEEIPGEGQESYVDNLGGHVIPDGGMPEESKESSPGYIPGWEAGIVGEEPEEEEEKKEQPGEEEPPEENEEDSTDDNLGGNTLPSEEDIEGQIEEAGAEKKVSPMDIDFLIILFFALAVDIVDIILELTSVLVIPKLVGIIIDAVVFLIIGGWMYWRTKRIGESKKAAIAGITKSLQNQIKKLERLKKIGKVNQKVFDRYIGRYSQQMGKLGTSLAKAARSSFGRTIIKAGLACLGEIIVILGLVPFWTISVVLILREK